MLWLEYHRKTAGFTQTELASRLLYSKATICRLERGRPSPGEVHPRLRNALERFFNRPIEHLLSTVEVIETFERTTPAS